MAPSLEWTWPAWRLANVIATIVLMGGGVWLTCTHPIPTGTTSSGPASAGDGTSFFAVFSESYAALSLLVLTVGVSLAATALVPFFCSVARLTCCAILPSLGVALAIKLLHIPERWFGDGSGASSILRSFDLSYSPLHSHSLWHMSVWGVQLLYYTYFCKVVAGRIVENGMVHTAAAVTAGAGDSWRFELLIAFWLG